MSDPPSPIGELLALAGTCTVVLGVWLPWLVVSPAHAGGVPGVYMTGMERGFVAFDYLVLVALGGCLSAAFGASYRRGRRRLGAAFLGVAGVVTVLAVLYWVTATTGVDGTVLDVFVWGVGLYVTLGGAGLLVMAAAVNFVGV